MSTEESVQQKSTSLELPAMLKDFLGKGKAEEVADEMGYLIEQMKILGWKEMRPWSEFVAIFKPPQFNGKYIEQRMTTNILYYRTNYLIIAAIISILRILFSPFLIITLLICCSFTFYAKYILKAPLKIGEITINEEQKNLSIVGINVLTLLVMGALVEIIWMFIYSATICLFHMLLRPRSVSAKTNKSYEEFKIQNGGFSLFGTTNSTSTEKNDLKDPEDPTEKDDANSEPALNGYPNANKENLRKRVS